MLRRHVVMTVLVVIVSSLFLFIGTAQAGTGKVVRGDSSSYDGSHDKHCEESPTTTPPTTTPPTTTPPTTTPPTTTPPTTTPPTTTPPTTTPPTTTPPTTTPPPVEPVRTVSVVAPPPPAVALPVQPATMG
jgi:hypothetical protein